LVTTQDPFTTGLIGVFSKIFFGVKLNIQVHNDFFNNRLFRSESRQNFLQYILGRFNLVFADSVRVVAKRLNYKDHSFTAPVPVPLDYFWGRPKAKKGFRIVSVGRLVKQKNYPLLIGAAKFLIKIFPTMKIKIVGDGPERQHLKKIISELGLKKVVKLVGSKTPGEIRKLFFDSNLYVQTSDYEGWGMGIIEAAASGLPIVMTDTGCAGEIIKDQETFGLVIPQNDSLELVTAISTVFTNTPFFKKIILKGQNVLKKRYTLDQLITQMVSGYEKTVTKK
jgi:glycosyltransferase involved in cell wall biosynthesis